MIGMGSIRMLLIFCFALIIVLFPHSRLTRYRT
jgi:hypothetical protein